MADEIQRVGRLELIDGILVFTDRDGKRTYSPTEFYNALQGYLEIQGQKETNLIAMEDNLLGPYERFVRGRDDGR